MTTPVQNPVNFQITDPTFVADAVTSMTIEVGTTSGGPYPNSFTVPAADVTAQSGGVVKGTLASLNMGLGNGTYFAVATATNANGTSKPTPETSFQILGEPSAPTALLVS